MKKELPQVTLIGVDCINLDKLKRVATVCQNDFTFGDVLLLSSIPDSDSRVVTIPHIGSVESYSSFCIKEMWKYIKTEYALIIQNDGFILNPSAWTDDFLQYDYIGSPWYHFGPPIVGNGGFSLRSKKLIDLIAHNYENIGGKLHPEDNWICRIAQPFLEKNGIIFAPEYIAKKFSKEGNERGIFWNNEFGFHGLYDTDISLWTNAHPEYKDLSNQKLKGFCEFMRKYPSYDKTFHVFQCKPIQTQHYIRLAHNEKKYDCRMDTDIKYFDPIEVGHNLIYKLFRISAEKVQGTPTFDKTITAIEKFKSKQELISKYPDIQITPSFNIPKWRQRLVKIFGNLFFPQKISYTIFWF